MFTGHNCDVSKLFRNQSQLFRYQKMFNSEVSKPIMKPDDNVSKPIMKLKYNKYIYIYNAHIHICPFFIISRQSNPKIHYLDSRDVESL